jgi:hypothetical protein
MMEPMQQRQEPRGLSAGVTQTRFVEVELK